MGRVVGHEKQMNLIEAAYAQNKLPHALLLVGAEGIGKSLFALATAQMLLCPEGPPACGACGACLRVAKQQSESLLIVRPEGTHIKVDQARRVLNFLSLAALGKNRVIIIEEAHLLNQQAANSILKILEEPEPDTFFILISPQSESLIGTIRSRTQVIRFTPLTIDETKKLRPGLPEWVYKCARGQVSKLETLSQDSDKRVLSLDLMEAFWVNPQFILQHSLSPSTDSQPKLNWRDVFKDKEEAITVVKNWILFLRDLIVLKSGSRESVLNLDQADRLNSFREKSFNLSPKKLDAFISALLRVEKEILGHADVTLLIESLWVKHARK